MAEEPALRHVAALDVGGTKLAASLPMRAAHACA